MSDPEHTKAAAEAERNTERAAATGGPPVLSATDARQGQTTGHVRWILGVSLALAIAAMATSWVL
jgi:ferric-dicitrate binding protein FerR (iron transport regulator)